MSPPYTRVALFHARRKARLPGHQRFRSRSGCTACSPACSMSDIRHPGACHLYIHATESSQEPERALNCAPYLSETVPIASHIQHMPSHTYNEVGMWGEAVRREHQTPGIRTSRPKQPTKGFSYAAGHNLHMLLYTPRHTMARARHRHAGRTRLRETNQQHDVRRVDARTLWALRRSRYAGQPPGRRGRRCDVGLRITATPSLKEGDMEKAIEATRRDVGVRGHHRPERFRFHPAGLVVGTVAQHSRWRDSLGARRPGRRDQPLSRKPSRVEDEMDYDEPEPLPFSARHWLGAALLASRATTADAEQTSIAHELDDHPHNGWSLHGLKAALEAQGKTDPAG